MSLAAAQAAPKAPVQDMNSLNGYWDVEDESRHAVHQEKPQFTPQAEATAKAQAAVRAARVAKGLVVGLGTYICGESNPPNAYTTSEPWALVIGKNEVVQVNERPSIRPRHFWMDGRTWPADWSKVPAATSGYSIGHWEGPDLVVETRHTAGNALGGGMKTLDTVMTERFHMIEGGKRMELSITFTDPAIYTKPFTLKYLYDRRDLGTFAFGDFCDPNHDNGRINSTREDGHE